MIQFDNICILVTQDETLRLLYRYCALTNDKIDRVKFCDLLHDWFGMTDDYFMDKGKYRVCP